MITTAGGFPIAVNCPHRWVRMEINVAMILLLAAERGTFDGAVFLQVTVRIHAVSPCRSQGQHIYGGHAW